MTALAGKVAFITGGAHGIGLELGRRLAAEHMAVAITDIDGPAAEKAAAALRDAGGKSVGLKLDVTNAVEFAKAADTVESTLGPVCLLCSNAGVASAQSIIKQTPLEAVSDAEWSWLLGINLTGQFNAIRTFVPRFKSVAEPSHILVTASMAGITPQVAAVPGAYTVSKFGVIGLYEQLRLELEEFRHVGITVLCPGVVKTSIQKHTLERATYMADSSAHEDNNPYARGGEMLFGMEPTNVAKFAVDAVLSDRFYAFPHPEYARLTSRFHARVMAAFGVSAQPGYADTLPE